MTIECSQSVHSIVYIFPEFVLLLLQCRLVLEAMDRCRNPSAAVYKCVTAELVDRHNPVSYTHLDVYKRQVLSKEYWGKGLMPEAVNRVIKFCFEQENYDYLMCSHFVINSQSKRVIEKSGFRFVKENTQIARDGHEYISLYYVLDLSLIHI